MLTLKWSLDLLTLLPSSFQSEEYRNRRQEIEQEWQDQQEQTFRALDNEAEKKGIVIMRTPGGYTMGPMIDGHLLDPQEYAKSTTQVSPYMPP